MVNWIKKLLKAITRPPEGGVMPSRKPDSDVLTVRLSDGVLYIDEHYPAADETLCLFYGVTHVIRCQGGFPPWTDLNNSKEGMSND